MASERPAEGQKPGASWKERYAALAARLANTKTELKQTRDTLRAAHEHDRATRDTLASVRARLHRYERLLLRPEVVADLMPARARYCRETPPDGEALAREATHIVASESYAAARSGGAPPGADRVQISGVTWWVPADNRTEGQLADRVLNRRHLPLPEILRTREAISNGTMIDIGANIGLTSVTRAILGDAAIVYAAEPAPDNFACLVRTVLDNGLRGIVLPDHVAISDRDGTATLRLSGSIGGHALTAGGEGVEVPTMRLDAWLRKLSVNTDAIRYVKIDTQGHEAHVLAGAPDLLARPGVAWELEFSPHHLQKMGRNPSALIAHMQAVFTHFIDLNPHAPGARVRPVAELPDAVAYLERNFTNLLAYRRSE
jgi:FkbM family methyltransferase